MKPEKAMLLACALAALAAFAVPAATQAEHHEWYDHEGNTITESTTIEGTAELSNLVSGIS